MQRPRIWKGLTFALLGVALAAAARYEFLAVLGNRSPFTTFYLLVTLASLYGGLWPGATATLLATCAASIWMDRSHPAILDAADWLRCVMFAASGFTVAGVCETMHRARARARQTVLLQKQKEELEFTAQRLQASEAMAHARAGELTAVLDAMPALIFIAHDRTCSHMISSRAARELLRLPEGANVSKSAPATERPMNFRAMRGGRELPPEELPVQMAVATGKPVRDVELSLVFDDGTSRDIQGDAIPLFDAQGEVRGAVGAFIDVTDRRRVEQARAEASAAAETARKAAEAASAAKDHFLAVLSHELRTPLTPALAAIGMLQTDPHTDVASREILEIARRNCELEALLIDDLLDITRIAQGKMQLELRPVRLLPILQYAIDVCRPDMQARHLHLAMKLPQQPLVVQGDPLRLQQVFWNVLKNAVKFSESEGDIRIRCLSDHHTISVEISDDGVGISAAALPRIFEPFEQGSAGVTRRFGGLGLGLTITKAIMEHHGGSVEAQSEGEGKGATFILRLPLLHADVPQAPPAAGAPAPQLKLRILLVEDHGDTAQVVARLLMKQGHEVRTAGDVASALALAAAEPFDLLLSDLGLPDATGFELMQQLRARGQTLQGIAISGYGQQQDVQHSLDAGFAMHLTKPVTPDRLGEAVQQMAVKVLAGQSRTEA